MKYSVETLPRMDADIKKKAGLYTNNTFKGNNNFEKVPTFNGVELLTNDDLNGTNYVMIYGVGDPTENAAELLEAYNVAKTMPQYLGLITLQTVYKGQTFQSAFNNYYYIKTETGLVNSGTIPSDSTRITLEQAVLANTTIIIPPSNFTYGINRLTLDRDYINLVSLTGNCDINIDGINVTGNNIFLRGINTHSSSFNILGTNVITENCAGLNLVIYIPNALVGGNPNVLPDDIQKYVNVGFNLSGLIAAHLSFTNAYFINANFRNASFEGTSFTGAAFDYANLENCSFSTAVFSSIVTFNSAKINGANFTGATGLSTINETFPPLSIAVNSIVTWTDGNDYANNGITWIQLGGGSGSSSSGS